MVNKPSIGRYTKLEEPKARESLLTPTLRKTLSKISLSSTPSQTSTVVASSSSTLTVDPTLEPSTPVQNVPDTGALSAMPMLKAVNAAALMERTHFAIDDVKDEEDEDDDDIGEGHDNDDQVMDEVHIRNFNFRLYYFYHLFSGRRFLGSARFGAHGRR